MGRSLASVKDLKSLTSKITGLDLNGCSLDIALKDYESVCQLRHAAVHNHGRLGAKNIQELEIEQKCESKLLRLDYKALQEISQICLNAVRAFNIVMYKKIITRWITDGLLSGKWGKDKTRYMRALELFYSKEDTQVAIDFKKFYKQLLPEIISKGSSTKTK